MFLTVSVNELTRRLKFLNSSAVVVVSGDNEINGIIFQLPASYEGGFDFSTATWRVNYTDTAGDDHTILITETDESTGYPFWQFDDVINKGANGTVKFAFVVSNVDADTAAVSEKWNSLPGTFSVLKTVTGSNSDEEAEENTTYDRLASAVQTIREAQASVDNVGEVLASLTGSSPQVVDTVADLANIDTTQYLIAVVLADGYLYYYDGSDWQQGFVYGSYELDDELPEDGGASGKAADSGLVGEEIGQLKADLSDKVDKVTGKGLSTNDYTDAEKQKVADAAADVETLEQYVDGSTYTAGDMLATVGTNSYKLNTNGYLASGSGLYTVKSYLVAAGETLYLNLSKDGEEDEVVFNWQSSGAAPSASSGNIVQSVKTAVNGFVTVPEGTTHLFVCQLNTNTTNEVKTVTASATGLMAEIYELIDRQTVEPSVDSDLTAAAKVNGAYYSTKVSLSKIPITAAGYIKVTWRDCYKTTTNLTFVVCKKTGSSFEVVGKFAAQSIGSRTNIFVSDYYVDGKNTYYIGYYGMNPCNIQTYDGYGWIVGSDFDSADALTVGSTISMASSFTTQSLALIPSVITTEKKIRDDIAELRAVVDGNAANEPEKYVHFSIDDCEFWTALIDNAETYESAFEEPHLALYKSYHDLYGICITLNVFCTSGDYSIENVPSTWAAEFAENANWLKFAYHAEDASTYLSNLTADAAAASYAKFVNGIYAMAGTTDAIDRIARLGFFDGSEENCLVLRDCACGIVGLLCADDTRNSYYLTATESEFVRTHAYYRDYENQLIFLNTIRRFEYYSVSDAAELLTAAKGNINRYVEFFVHEDAAAVSRIGDFAAWAVTNGYKFGFMQQILRV